MGSRKKRSEQGFVLFVMDRYSFNKERCKSTPNNCLRHKLQSIVCMNSVVVFQSCWMLRVRLKRGRERIVTEEFMRGLRHEKFLTFYGTECLWVLPCWQDPATSLLSLASWILYLPCHIFFNLWCILILTYMSLYQFLCGICMLMEGLTHYSKRNSVTTWAVSHHVSKVNAVVPDTMLSVGCVIVHAVKGVNRNC